MYPLLYAVRYLSSCPDEVREPDHSDDDSRLGAQVTVGIGGAHILVAHLTDVNVLDHMSGKVGGGDGAEEITQQYK